MKTQGNETPLFNKKLLNSVLKQFSIKDNSHFLKAHSSVLKYKNSIENGNLEKTKEVSIQGKFLEVFFEGILGFTQLTEGEAIWTMEQESKVKQDGSTADGSLGFFYNVNGKIQKDIRAVIELKDAKTDLDKKQNRESHLTPVEQGFSYAYKNGSSCKWVIISNFKEIRLYRSNSSIEFEQFFITDFDDVEEFKKFYYLLNQDRFIQETGISQIDQLLIETEQVDEDISDQFYADYSELREQLFESLIANNPEIDKLTLFSKSQKLMDRFLFICFSEDKGLLPAHLFSKIINTAKQSFKPGNTKVWDELKGLFIAIDIGNSPMDISGYNGGLFKEDSILDGLIITDDVLEKFDLLARVDFESDVNVNILGHVFEHSLEDIEKIKNSIRGIDLSKKKSKRKKDGIYYTKEYITDYIVEKTLGRWMDDQKNITINALVAGTGYKFIADGYYENGKKLKKRTITLKQWDEIPEEGTIAEAERDAIVALHQAYYERYALVLKDLRVLDPACGSGAFLNSALKFIAREISYVNDMLDSLRGGALSFIDIDRQILENNLYGVDINEESVEITKLSLWLQTAKKGQKLTSLDHAIKCGNSLISDPAIAEELTFDWREAFPNIMDNGGFDVIIGNPPYGAELTEEEKNFIKKHYATTQGEVDTYLTFFELAMNLLKTSGYLGYITPNTYFTIESGKKLRQFLFNKNTLLNIVEVFNVFEDAVVEPIISVYQKGIPEKKSDIEIILVSRGSTLSSTFYFDGDTIYRSSENLFERKDLIFNYKATLKDINLFEKISIYAEPLSTYYPVYNGAKPYEVGKGTPPQTRDVVNNKIYNGLIKHDDTWLPYMRGKYINRYANLWEAEYISYGPWLAAPRDPSIFFREKIFVRQTGDQIIATYDEKNVSNDTLHIVYGKNNRETKYLLGLLNSKLFFWIYRFQNPTEIGKPMAQVKKVFIERLPVKIATNTQQHAVINYVNELLIINQNIVAESRKFIKYLKVCYNFEKVSERLKNFYLYDFKTLLAELKKVKVRIKVAEQIDLMDVFDQYKENILEQKKKAFQTDHALDLLVYQIYELSEEDIAYIDETQ